MFSNLGPLFKTHFRQTEANDTRQHIPHEEKVNHHGQTAPDEQKKKPKQQWTDDTTVSVIALRSFLIDFLKTLPNASASTFIKDHDPKENIAARPQEKKRPTNTHNAKAVRAYQTMAAHRKNKGQDKNTNITKTKEKNNNDGTGDELKSKELRDIRQLIIDLENLEQHGITTLNILRAPSFIEGMKQAVILAQSRM